jgi:predicted protein tyrosine phosphatase
MISARSAGTSTVARRKVTRSDIRWADLIFVMEEKHRSKLLAEFPDESAFKEIYVLNIEDNYRYMDQELIDELVKVVDPIIYNRQLAT